MDSSQPRHLTADTLLSISLRLLSGRHMEICLRSTGALSSDGRDRFTREIDSIENDFPKYFFATVVVRFFSEEKAVSKR